jgi:hypothetical protein
MCGLNILGTRMEDSFSLSRNGVWHRFGPQNRQLRFGDLGHKITAIVSWFGHQNHEGYGFSVTPQNWWEDETVLGMRQDRAAWFMRKQVGLGFPSLASRLVETRRGWCMRHHHGGCIDVKLKMDGSMRRAASDPATLTLPFSFYEALGAF